MKDYTEYLDDYISGTLPSDKMVEFQAMLAIDNELKEEYYILLNARKYIKARKVLYEMANDPKLKDAEELVTSYFKELSMKSRVEDSQSIQEFPQMQQDVSRSPYKEISRFRSFSVAKKIAVMSLPSAAIIASVFLVIKLFVLIEPNTRIYDRYYAPLQKEVLELEMVRGFNNAAYHSGIDCYLNKDYSCAIAYFSKSPETSYYNGLAHLGLEDFEDAIKSFLIFKRKNPEHPGVNWFIGLTYLRMGDLEAASISLERVTGISSMYNSEAEKLIVKIEKIE